MYPSTITLAFDILSISRYHYHKSYERINLLFEVPFPRGPKAHDDTVHEMARDEARHGKAFKGLLERYFGK